MRRLHTVLQVRSYLPTSCALLSLLIIVALVIPALLLKLLLVIFSCLLYPLLSSCFPIIVEHLYMWPCVGRLHVRIMDLGRRGKPDKIFHSRFLDLLVEVLTEVSSKARTVAAPALTRTQPSPFREVKSLKTGKMHRTCQKYQHSKSGCS